MSANQQTKYRWMGISLGLSIVLLVLKFTAYFLTNSTAILTDAVESIVNVIASGFAFYSIYLAGQPADQNHPYGHGKIEFLSSGFEGAMILSAGLVICWQAVLSFFEPKALRPSRLGYCPGGHYGHSQRLCGLDAHPYGPSGGFSRPECRW